MSKQQKHQRKQQIDDEEDYNLRQENQYMKAELRDIQYTMQGIKATSQKAEASCKEREETQTDEMGKMQEKFKGFEVSNLDQATAYEEEKQRQRNETEQTDAATNVEKGKQKDEMVEMQGKIQRLKDEMEEILANIWGIRSDNQEERLHQQEELEKLQTEIRGGDTSSSSGGPKSNVKEVIKAYSQVSLIFKKQKHNWRTVMPGV